MKRFALIGVVALATSAVQAQTCQKPCGSEATACAQGEGTAVTASWEQGDKDIVDTAMGSADLSTLVGLIKEAGLVETLKGKGPFTVFAPTNAAFAKLPKEAVEAIKKDKAKLTAVLAYHVLPARADAKAVTGMKEPYAATVQGQRVNVSVTGSSVMVDGATVTKTDILCANGVIHVIDAVLMPETRDIPTLAMSNPDLSTLVGLLKDAGLVETLQGKGPFTVFAPTNAAFAKVPAADLAALAKDKEKLKSVLLYHVVAGSVYAEQVAGMASAKTVQGSSVKVSVKDGSVMIDGAKVAAADVETANGVVHVIDSVLMPK